MVWNQWGSIWVVEISLKDQFVAEVEWWLYECWAMEHSMTWEKIDKTEECDWARWQWLADTGLCDGFGIEPTCVGGEKGHRGRPLTCCGVTSRAM
jgi:hypothetical protein